MFILLRTPVAKWLRMLLARGAGSAGRGRPAEDLNLIFREAGEDDLQDDLLCALMALRG